MESNGVEDRKPKTVRVRKRVSIDTGESAEARLKRSRVVKVVRRVEIDPTKQGPVPGSIEEDFLLEHEGDPKAFLKVTVADTPDAPDFGPRYYPEGKLVPYSVVGPPDLFEKQHTAEMKTRSLEEKSQSDLVNDSSLRRSIFNPRKANKTPNDTPEQRFQKKQLIVEEGKVKDKNEEVTRLRSLPIGLRIIEDRQTKCLREFELRQADWNVLATNLAAKAGKDEDQLVINQSQAFREKLEEMDYLDRALSAEEKAGPHAWYMSLRAGKNDSGSRGAYLPVGNLFSGLYTQMRERTQSAEVMIRRPQLKQISQRVEKRELTPIEEDGTEPRPKSNANTTRKTFRDYPYFQKRMKEEELKKSLHPVQATSPQLLWVQGSSKYQAELRTLQILGLEHLHPEPPKAGDLTEEIIVEDYEAKFKY